MAQNSGSLSRRSFFKVTGAGAAAAVAAGTISSPSFQTSTSGVMDAAGRLPRPWWVRTVDVPTTEIDWDKLQRYDERKTVRNAKTFASYVGEETANQLNKEAAENEIQRLRDNVPGYTLKDQALYAAQMWDLRLTRSFLGPQTAKTPEERGVPKWSGSPDEAARILRVAMRHFGAAHVAFVELNEQTRRLIYAVDPDGKEMVFADVDAPAETETQRIIPNKAKYVIVYTVQMSEETLKRAPTVIGAQTTLLTYGRAANIQGQTQEFLRGLGYMGLGEHTVNALGIAPAFGVLAGLGEMGRMNRMLSPEFGPMVRVFKILTDLPVALDKPINAGISEFCRRCKKCAEACPSGALSFDTDPTWEIKGPFNNPGHRAWFDDASKCMTQWKKVGTNCGICFAVCPFAKKNKAWIHDWVRATVSAAPAMDEFVRSMDDAFGYGAQRDQESWWSLDLPECGIDSTAPCGRM